MNQDFLLLAGACVMAWTIGIELGAKVMGEQLTKPLSDLAASLAGIHETHADAKQKKEAHDAALANLEKAKSNLNSRLESHISRLRSEYSI